MSSVCVWGSVGCRGVWVGVFVMCGVWAVGVYVGVLCVDVCVGGCMFRVLQKKA